MGMFGWRLTALALLVWSHLVHPAPALTKSPKESSGSVHCWMKREACLMRAFTWMLAEAGQVLDTRPVKM